MEPLLDFVKPVPKPGRVDQHFTQVGRRQVFLTQQHRKLGKIQRAGKERKDKRRANSEKGEGGKERGEQKKQSNLPERIFGVFLCHRNDGGDQQQIERGGTHVRLFK
jgi:hypothetical protein